jgi:hypothetical protein
MKIESPAFTDVDLDGFLDDAWRYEVRFLADRLAAASARLSGLAERIAAAGSAANDEWSAQETLAHVASLSKYYGVLAYKMARGDAGMEWLGDVRGRDDATRELATHASPAELVAATQTAHRRTLEWLREARIQDLTRRVRIGEGRHFSAEEIIRLGLCAHIEMHLEQIEQALGPRPVAR